MRRSFLHIALAVACMTACNDNDDIAPSTLNFTRPIDIAFACYGSLRITNGGTPDPSQTIIPQAQPTEACDIRSTYGSGIGSGSNNGLTDPQIPTGQEDLGSGITASVVGTSAWYAFILQSVPGTLGLATFATQPASRFSGVSDVTVLDADPLSPGKTGITMGTQPIGVITDFSGCYEVTANAGTCDLSALDVTSALNYQTDPLSALGSDHPVRVDSMQITDGAGIPLRSKPAAIAVQSPDTDQGDVGKVCPEGPTGLVYIAYPSCHLVAAIDLATSTAVAAVEIGSDGTPTIVRAPMGSDGITLTCPDECSGGGSVTDGARPTSLDVQTDPTTGRRTLAIGTENSNVVTVVDLDTNYYPSSTSTVVLENTTGSIGVNQVRVSPAIAMGGVNGNGLNDGTIAPGGHMQFLYAITNDASVRVANILTGTTTANMECDTQVDPRYLRYNGAASVPAMSCMPVGGSNTPPRRAGAIGPGIVLVNRMPAIATATETTSITSSTTTTVVGGTQAITVPMGIDIFHVPSADDGNPSSQTTATLPTSTSPTTLYGYFAVITGANGQTYVLNIDDDAQSDYVGEQDNSLPAFSDPTLATEIPLDIANQMRDAVPNRGDFGDLAGDVICDTDGPDPDDDTGNEGGPRSYGQITITLPTSPTTIVSSAKANELPSIHQVACIGSDTAGSAVPVSEISFPAPVSVRDVEYPDWMGMNADETWSLTWEGSLSVDTDTTATNGPVQRTGMLDVDATGMYLVDQTEPFCAAGTQPWDILQVTGCDPTLGNADCPPNYVCFVHPDSTVTDAGECMLSTEADRLADTCKEFLVSERRYTIGETTTGQLKLLPRKHVLRTTPLDGCTGDAQCKTLADYALQNDSPNNPLTDTTPPDSHTWGCMLDPDRAPDVDGSGNVIDRCIEECGSGGDADCDPGTVCQDGICMEGIEAPQACLNGPEHYELQAGEAFVVAGTLSGFHHNVIADGSGNCIQDPNGSPFNIGRLPLEAPACDPTANPLGILPDGTVEANPCETTVSQLDTEETFLPGCVVGSAAIMPRQADAIVFRGPAFNLTVVDPTYPGDANCIGDRLGGLGRVPLVPDNTSMTVRITGGFRPLFLGIQPALPGKVVRGPTQSIWVMDEGDYISESYDIASTSGKVFRIESGSIGIINILE